MKYVIITNGNEFSALYRLIGSLFQTVDMNCMITATLSTKSKPEFFLLKL